VTATKVYFRKADLTIDGEVDDFTKLEAVIRFSAAGSWILDVPASFAAELGPGAGIVVRRGPTTLFSGPVTEPARRWNKDTDSLSVAGVTDECHPDDRLALPSDPPYAADDYDVRTGPAETVIKGYVAANQVGPTTGAGRPTGLVVAADLGRGGTVTGRARFDNLGDLIRSLAVAGGDLGWRIVQQGTDLVFDVYEPVDHSATAKFSPVLGNLQSFEYKPTVSKANYAIVGGGGQGTARVFVEGGDAGQIARWGRRIETFRDRRDTTAVGELGQTRDEELANNAEKLALTIAPIDTAAIQFLRDYNLGDKITVEIDGTPIVDVVREVKLTIDASGEKITPTAGTPEAAGKGWLGVFGQVRTLTRKVSQLERRV
jgi:hypothetical protein